MLKHPKHMFAYVILCSVCLFVQISFADFPVSFEDSRGQDITVTAPPERVVSLVPSITDMVYAMEADDHLVAHTYHTTLPGRSNNKSVIGGFFRPSLDAIESLKPDLIIVSSFHQNLIPELEKTGAEIVQLRTKSLAQISTHIVLLGRIFDCPDVAADVADSLRKDLAFMRKKSEKIPQNEKRRTIRLMGRSSVMTPGDDAFQNEFIKLAGGIPPELGKDGSIVNVTLEEWKAFNPQVIYGCYADKEVANAFFHKPGWKDVEAVKNDRIYYFPAALTCRATVHSGYFVKWLAGVMYADFFVDESAWVRESAVVGRKAADIKLPYVANAEWISTHLFDFTNKTFSITLKEPMTVLSTSDGWRTDITTIGNHYSPPPTWNLLHNLHVSSPGAFDRELFQTLDISAERTALLKTGADMDNISIQQISYKEFVVYALVTAGVRGNAQRASQEAGFYYEKPGTINIMILTNREMSPAAMTRALICVTEAKTAAMQRLDVRSTLHQHNLQATGTGTDSILILQGSGAPVTTSGGHTKVGELISRAVYAGVLEAVYKQNGMQPERTILRRLEERTMLPHDIASELDTDVPYLTGELEDILLKHHYASVLSMAFALENAQLKLKDLDYFEPMLIKLASDIAGKPVMKVHDYFTHTDYAPLVARVLDAFVEGIVNRGNVSISRQGVE